MSFKSGKLRNIREKTEKNFLIDDAMMEISIDHLM
jgi:hypothetical protein